MEWRIEILTRLRDAVRERTGESDHHDDPADD
jgi:hypothetical protein